MKDQGPLSTLLGASLPEAARDALPSDLEPTLEAFVSEAKAAFPEVTLAEARFLERVGELFAELPSDAPLASLRAPELYLACAAASGSDIAISLLESRYLGDARAAVARMNLGQARMDDVLQIVRRRLFVAEVGGRPKILEYGGRGELRGWLRVTAVRDALKVIRSERHEVASEDERLLELPVGPGDPELEQMKALYRPAFKQAFVEAFSALTPRQKNLLRQQVLDELSIDDLATLYHAHRATCARWLEGARQTLLDETKRLLMAKIGIDESECDSIIRLVHSQLHVTLRRLLGS